MVLLSEPCLNMVDEKAKAQPELDYSFSPVSVPILPRRSSHRRGVAGILGRLLLVLGLNFDICVDI